jgi:hypothetical protein
MPFHVIQPPNEEARLAEVGKEIVAASLKLGAKLEVEPFLISWLNGTRVVVERNTEKEIVGLALVAVGKRWVQNDFAATVLFFNGSDALFDFIKQICTALGASDLYVESGVLTESSEKSTYEIIRYHLS